MTKENKKFLTLQEAKEKADYCDEYMKGVYKYELDGKWFEVKDGITTEI